MSDYLKNYIQDWRLDNPTKLTSTATSDVYLADSKYGRVVLKILNELGIKDELPGSYFLKNCQGNGAVHLFHFDERALLIEYLPGENLYQFSKVNNEDKASEVFCAIIKKIRKPTDSIDASNLVDYTNLFSVLDELNVDEDLSKLLERGKYLGKSLLASQNEEVLLHGDLHHENIISRQTGEFVCFDPKGLIGDPAYELGTTLKNPWDYPKISLDMEIFQRRAKYFSRELNLPYNRVINFSFVHLCLSIAWAIQDGASFDHQYKLAKELVRTKLVR